MGLGTHFKTGIIISETMVVTIVAGRVGAKRGLEKSRLGTLSQNVKVHSQLLSIHPDHPPGEIFPIDKIVTFTTSCYIPTILTSIYNIPQFHTYRAMQVCEHMFVF